MNTTASMTRLAALALALCASVGAAQKPIHEKFSKEDWGPFSYRLCSGESISFKGWTQGQYTAREIDFEHYFFETTMVHRGEGTSANGVKYRLEATFKGVTEVRGLQGTATNVYPLHLIGQGGAPDRTMKIRSHITVNANGEVTTATDIFDDSCER